MAPVRYRSPDEDSARWLRFGFRDGDIVISTRSKSGTTWAQMICALLIFQTPHLPAPLHELSPWLDMLVVPEDEVLDRLEAQRHRRFIKTHTPLDGIPLDDRATYIVVARHPLDIAVSLYHQGDNLDRDRIRRLTGRPPANDPLAHDPPAHDPRDQRPPLREWLVRWISKDVSHLDEMDSLPGVLWHFSDAWRRRHRPNVVLLHYSDLSRDLGGEMRSLARRLGIQVSEAAWPDLVAAASFAAMKARPALLAPNPSGILKDPAAFFRQGRSGAGAEALDDDALARYRARVVTMAPPDLLEWLHH